MDEPPSHPSSPPPKKLSRPKITLQIPEQQSRGPSMYWTNPRYQGRAPGTAISHTSGPQANPYFNPFAHMYQKKASDFMFKQFEGFKDFTMSTAKSGLSAGEKTAFWFFSKVSTLSKRWFTHIFLCLCLVLYSAMGAGIFMTLEGNQDNAQPVKVERNLTDVRKQFAVQLQDLLRRYDYIHGNSDQFLGGIKDLLEAYEENYTEYKDSQLETRKWTFWNAMFYAGTIYTTIGKWNILSVLTQHLFSKKKAH